VGKVEPAENAKLKNGGKQRQTAGLKALRSLLPRLLLLQELAFNDKKY
jgi:hypothetical protein